METNNVLEFTKTSGINNELEIQMRKQLVLEHCIEENEDFAWEVIHKAEGHRQKMIDEGIFTQEYFFVNTSEILMRITNLLRKAGINFTWRVDWVEPTGKDGGEYTGKHRVILEFPDIEISTGSGTRTLCIYLYNSYDGTMRLMLFAGILEALCANGTFLGAIVNEESFYRKIHRLYGRSIEEIAQEVAAKAESVANDVSDYITKRKYEEDVWRTQQLENITMSAEDIITMTQQLLTTRISMLTKFSTKFFDNGGRIAVSRFEAAKFAVLAIQQARKGQEDRSAYSVYMRLQETLGGNPFDVKRNEHIPARAKYKVHSSDQESKEQKIVKFQFRNLTLAHEMNKLVANTFKELVPAEVSEAA